MNLALCCVLCASVWEVISATGLSVLRNTYSTCIFHVILFTTCVRWNKTNKQWMNDGSTSVHDASMQTQPKVNTDW